MTTYEVVKQISKDTSINEETVDLVLTEMTNVLNENFLSGNVGFSKIIKLAKKKDGLSFLTEETYKRIEESDTEVENITLEDVETIVKYMVELMRKSFKSGGMKNLMKIIKSLKNA